MLIPNNVHNNEKIDTILSSKRYKQNIETMDSFSSDILNLQPVTFTYIHDADNIQQVGLIAEDVLQKFPSLVVYDNFRIPESVKYHDLPVLLLNELKKAVTMIQELEKRVLELESHSY